MASITPASSFPLQYMNKIDQCGSVGHDAAVPEKQKINFFWPKCSHFNSAISP
jgi:hypothetical protein